MSGRIKSGASTVPALILASVLAAFIHTPSVRATGHTSDDAGAGHRAIAQDEQDDSLQKYLAFVDREWPDESEQQALTVRSLTLLIDAIAATSARSQLRPGELEAASSGLRTRIRVYQAGRPDELLQVKRLRDAFAAASDLISRIVRTANQGDALNARLAAMQRSVESLDPALPLRRQPDVIERFFTHAGEALREISASR